MRVCLIRHASTAWNESGRIQGRTDIPLSDLGRAQARSWRLPAHFAEVPCTTSPLSRARETAILMGIASPDVDDRLAEMSWGVFEGRTLAELRGMPDRPMGELETSGLDFRPPGGETPRLVAARLAACLRDLAADGRDRVLVTHRGVLRASFVLAFRWEMKGKPPVRFEPEFALIHELGPSGELSFVTTAPLRTGP